MTPLIALWNEFIQIWSVHFIRLTTAITKCWNDGKWFKRNQGWAMGVVAVFGEDQANSSIDFDTALPVRTDMQVIINGSVRCHSLSFLSTHRQLLFPWFYCFEFFKKIHWKIRNSLEIIFHIIHITILFTSWMNNLGPIRPPRALLGISFLFSDSDGR